MHTCISFAQAFSGHSDGWPPTSVKNKFKSLEEHKNFLLETFSVTHFVMKDFQSHTLLWNFKRRRFYTLYRV